MLAFQPVQLIDLATDITNIERIGQQIRDPLVANLTVFVVRVIWLGFQKPLHFRLCLKTPNCKSFNGLSHSAGVWLIWLQQFAMPFDGLIAKADRRVVDPVSQLHTGFHLLGHLPTVLLAL
ncbi:MAG: hypothetical protein ABJT31_10970 [Hyphomicrobiales bacterium]